MLLRCLTCFVKFDHKKNCFDNMIERPEFTVHCHEKNGPVIYGLNQNLLAIEKCWLPRTICGLTFGQEQKIHECPVEGWDSPSGSWNVSCKPLWAGHMNGAWHFIKIQFNSQCTAMQKGTQTQACRAAPTACDQWPDHLTIIIHLNKNGLTPLSHPVLPPTPSLSRLSSLFLCQLVSRPPLHCPTHDWPWKGLYFLIPPIYL